MKCRHGFVSNSSTSSFIAIGRLVDSPNEDELTPEELDEWYEDHIHLDDDNYIEGEILSYISTEDGGYDNKEISYNEVLKIFMKVCEKYNCSLNQVSLYFGMVQS